MTAKERSKFIPSLKSMNSQKSVSKDTVYCPVCQAMCDDAPISRYTASEAASFFCPPTRSEERFHRLKDSIIKLWQGESSVVLKCSNCGFGFGYPFVGGDEEFYSILHEQKGYPRWRWDYDVALSQLIENSEPGKLLEIGAGQGIFLNKLTHTWKCYATEGSDSTRRDLESLGVNVFRDLNLVIENHQNTFDIVVMFQVLEHISEFHEVLENCKKLLRSGGKIFITVPDGEAMIRQEKITGCPDMVPNHISKWTPKSLSIALIQHGFEPSSAILEPSSWHNFKGSLHLKLIADATNSKSLAAQAYRIQDKRVRSLLLTILAVPALLKMLPHFQDLNRGGAFGMVGTLKNND